MVKLDSTISHSLGVHNTEHDMKSKMVNSKKQLFKFAAHAATDSSSDGTVLCGTKWVHFYAKDYATAASAKQHTWFRGDQVVIQGFGSMGAGGARVATLYCSPITLNFADGHATASIRVLSGAIGTLETKGIWNIRVKKARVLGESIATRHVWKFRWKT